MEQLQWKVVGVVWVLGLCGCGAPGRTTDAGLPDASTGLEGDAGAGGDAGSVDGGASDAGAPEVEPDGGPREPTGAATQVLFQDDFERWANTAAIKGSYGDQREQNASFSLDGTVAAAGSRSLRIDYPANSGCQDADVFIGKVLANTSPLTAVLSYRFRFSRDFRFQQPSSWCQGRGLGSTEAVLGREGMARGALVLAAQAEPDAGVGLRWQVTVRDVRAQVTPAQPNAVYRQQVRLTRLGPAALADEGWHRLTMLVQRETSLGAGNGVLRVWIDGDAVLDYDGDGSGPWRGQVFTGTAPFGSIAFPTSLVTGASQAQSRWFDEVVLFEP